MALLFLLPTPRSGMGADANDVLKSIAELQTGIEAVLKETGTPGAGIAVVSRDQVEWVAGIGKSDVAANQPATADTLFRIGSISKGFAALAALQLQEQGKLRLTDTVKQWVPEVAFTNPWEATDPVRLVHLMEHTAGFDDIHPREYALNAPNISLKDALGFGASSRVSRWRPGTRMSYCNSGPAVLAAVIEKVSGQRFEDYVREHFFQPLHMETAGYFFTPEVERRLSTLYHTDGVTPYPYWHIAYRPSGSIHASPTDMANYVRFLLQRGSLDGTQLLLPESIERMETTETLPSAKLGPLSGYGLYNVAGFQGRFVFRGHIGGMMGAVADMGYFPTEGRGYAVMLNSGNYGALGQISGMVRQYLVRDLTQPPLPPPATVPLEVQQHYGGYFQNITPRQQLWYLFDRLISVKQLSFTTNALSANTYGLHRERWLVMSDRLFRRENEPLATVALLPDAEGETRIQFNQNGAFGTWKKVSAVRIWGQAVAIVLILLLMISSLLFALIWIPRKFLGKLHNSGPLSVRILPLASVVLFIGFLFLFWKNLGDFATMGRRSPLTIGITLMSLAFPFATVASLYAIWCARAATMNRAAYWHAVLVTVAMAVVALYLGYWGWIGLRLWA